MPRRDGSMVILKTSFAIFWSNGDGHQFHADGWRFPLPGGGYDGPRDVVARFRKAFPSHVIHSVRDTSGRFLPFRS